MFLTETNRKPNLLSLKQVAFILYNGKKSKGRLLLASIWPFLPWSQVNLSPKRHFLSQEERRKESIYMFSDKESRNWIEMSSCREDICLFLPVTWENYISLEAFALYSLFETFFFFECYKLHRL